MLRPPAAVGRLPAAVAAGLPREAKISRRCAGADAGGKHGGRGYGCRSLGARTPSSPDRQILRPRLAPPRVQNRRHASCGGLANSAGGHSQVARATKFKLVIAVGGISRHGWNRRASARQADGSCVITRANHRVEASGKLRAGNQRNHSETAERLLQRRPSMLTSRCHPGILARSSSSFWPETRNLTPTHIVVRRA